ncbi:MULTISPECIES: phosphatase PAP2 family protein [Pontibacillus]|uniref:Phosphatidic acid phosphatase type 2/haloperoxidase domain-containing protein n=1 Tax=Pontibacillus chungwhensis TaxID=265426 RepID=A0ABY8UZJ3_9BACI|nr:MULTISPECIES: phosphatase PAP2 family protein [Pontibacillus]MCD5324975.1 hypothetical protein [Pontibacillus sp. HN14]WIF98932.1 hypothetical protein QNI29_04550 [Pontibacillus chungwhensis]
MESYDYFSKRSLHFLTVIGLVIALTLMILVLTNQAGLLDDWAAQFAEESGEGVHQFFAALTPFGSGKVLGPVALLFIFILGVMKKNRLQAVMMFFGVLVGYGVNLSLKSAIGRERPLLNESVEGFSFPSGHAMVSLICAVLAYYFLTRRAQSRLTVTVSAGIGFMLVFLIGLVECLKERIISQMC